MESARFDRLQRDYLFKPYSTLIDSDLLNLKKGRLENAPNRKCDGVEDNGNMETPNNYLPQICTCPLVPGHLRQRRGALSAYTKVGPEIDLDAGQGKRLQENNFYPNVLKPLFREIPSFSRHLLSPETET